MSRCLIQPSLAVITPGKPSYLLPSSVYRFNVPADQREKSVTNAFNLSGPSPHLTYVDVEGQKNATNGHLDIFL